MRYCKLQLVVPRENTIARATPTNWRMGKAGDPSAGTPFFFFAGLEIIFFFSGFDFRNAAHTHTRKKKTEEPWEPRQQSVPLSTHNFFLVKNFWLPPKKRGGQTCERDGHTSPAPHSTYTTHGRQHTSPAHSTTTTFTQHNGHTHNTHGLFPPDVLIKQTDLLRHINFYFYLSVDTTSVQCN